jgi:hypothetical protein
MSQLPFLLLLLVPFQNEAVPVARMAADAAAQASEQELAHCLSLSYLDHGWPMAVLLPQAALRSKDGKLQRGHARPQSKRVVSRKGLIAGAETASVEVHAAVSGTEISALKPTLPAFTAQLYLLMSLQI